MKGGPKKFRIVSLYLAPKKKARTNSGGEALHIALANGTATVQDVAGTSAATPMSCADFVPLGKAPKNGISIDANASVARR